MWLDLRLMSLTSPKPSTDSSGNILSPPLTTSNMDSSSGMSWDTGPAETRNDSHHPDTLLESTFFRNSKQKPPQTAQMQGHMPQPEEPTALTYVVSLLHTLPFLFQASPPPMVTKGGALQPLGLFELSEISQELLDKNPCGRIPIPMPSNPIYMNMHCSAIYTALHALPIALPHISMVSTLITATYPFHYGWNHPISFPISPTTPIPPIPVSRYTSLTETYYYSQLNDTVILS